MRKQITISFDSDDKNLKNKLSIVGDSLLSVFSMEGLSHIDVQDSAIVVQGEVEMIPATVIDLDENGDRAREKWHIL